MSIQVADERLCAVRGLPLHIGAYFGRTLASVASCVAGHCAELGLIVYDAPVLNADDTVAVGEFLTGTTRAVQPILSVDDVELGDGHRGPMTYKLMQAFAAAEARMADVDDHDATSS